MIHINNTSYDNSCKDLNFIEFCKLCDALKKFKMLNPEQKLKAQTDEYFELTGRHPEKPEKVLKITKKEGE